MAESILQRVKTIGLLRNMLHLLALGFIVVLPFAEPSRILEDTHDLIFGGIIPATAPLVFIVMMFDVMMCQIMKGDASEERISQLRLTIHLHLVFGITLLSLWLYSFKEILF